MVERHLALNDYDDSLLVRLYDAEYDAIEADLGFFTQCLQPGSLLELGCGSGRLAARLAVGGRRVVGLDLSAAMIARARARGSRAEFLVGDMQDFALGERFANLLIPFCGFNLLEGAEQRQACLACCAQHLRPGGQLLLDLLPPGPQATGLIPSQSVVDPATGERLIKETTVAHEPDRLVIGYRWLADEMPRLTQTLRLCILSVAQLEAELEAAGFFISDCWGDYRANPLSARSPRLIVAAERLID